MSLEIKYEELQSIKNEVIDMLKVQDTIKKAKWICF